MKKDKLSKTLCRISIPAVILVYAELGLPYHYVQGRTGPGASMG